MDLTFIWSWFYLNRLNSLFNLNFFRLWGLFSFFLQSGDELGHGKLCSCPSVRRFTQLQKHLWGLEWTLCVTETDQSEISYWVCLREETEDYSLIALIGWSAEVLKAIFVVLWIDSCFISLSCLSLVGFSFALIIWIILALESCFRCLVWVLNHETPWK